MSNTLLKAGCSALALAMTLGVASAQEAQQAQPNQSVRDRAAANVAAGGLRLGSFVAYPRLDLSAATTDNVFATETDAVEDTLYVLASNLRIQSNWARHAVGLATSFTARSYEDNESEDTEDRSVALDGRLDLGSRTTVAAAALASQESEPRFNGLGPDQLVAPIEFTRTRTDLAITQRLNRISLRLGFVREDFDYDDGEILVAQPDGSLVAENFEQDDRDFEADDIEGRVDFALSPDTGIFAAVAYRTRDFDQDQVLDRDSDGTRGVIGATFDVSQLARGEIAAGYNTTSFDGPEFRDVDGFTTTGQVEWFPTQITTVTVDVLRDTFASSIGQESSVERLQYGVRVDHELLRNVLIAASYTSEVDDYSGIDRKDDRQTLFGSVEYELNRILALTFTAERREQESTGQQRERSFEADRYGVALTLRR